MIEILCNGRVHYRRPDDHPDVEEAKKLIANGNSAYSIRKVKKYREYRFTEFAMLLDIVEIRTLPKNTKKAVNDHDNPLKPVEVWIASDREGGYSKICRISSDITFGTGVKSIAEKLKSLTPL